MTDNFESAVFIAPFKLVLIESRNALTMTTDAKNQTIPLFAGPFNIQIFKTMGKVPAQEERGLGVRTVRKSKANTSLLQLRSNDKNALLVPSGGGKSGSRSRSPSIVSLVYSIHFNYFWPLID